MLRLHAVSNPALSGVVIGRVLNPAVRPPLLEQERNPGDLALIAQRPRPLGAHRPCLEAAGLSPGDDPGDAPVRAHLQTAAALVHAVVAGRADAAGAAVD